MASFDSCSSRDSRDGSQDLIFMDRITPISWQKFEKFLFYVGCTFKREKGDHRIYTREGLKRAIVVPREKDLPIFVIKNNLRILGISNKEYLSILEKI